jgi:two-component system catabolic regulation response regulator CreB
MQRVLIIEDEPAIVDNMAYALRTEGFEVASCPTGQEGLADLREKGADLIVLDIGLPDGSGFDLCKKIREESDIPIIFLTARSDEVDRVVGLEIGGDDYVVKPFSPRELCARIKAVLRRARAGRPKRACEKPTDLPFEIDEKRFVICYFGTPLDLSRYEYRILRILIRRPGWVFSRSQLMEHAWEEPGISLDRTVDTHIKTIRAKLREVKPELNPIQTHRGLGYSLKDAW